MPPKAFFLVQTAGQRFHELVIYLHNVELVPGLQLLNYAIRDSAGSRTDLENAARRPWDVERSGQRLAEKAAAGHHCASVEKIPACLTKEISTRFPISH